MTTPTQQQWREQTQQKEGEMNFGDTLRELLKRHKITQRQLAKWTEISHETINRFLAGTYKPGQSSVEAIAYCYGFSEDERIALFRTARCLPTALIEQAVSGTKWYFCRVRNGRI